MEIYLSKRKALIGLFVLIAAAGAGLILLQRSGRSVAQAMGFDSGRNAALAGVQAFYTVNYQDSQDVWAARLCSVSTTTACDYYQKTVAPFLWPEFETSQTVVVVDAGDPVLLTEEASDNQMDAQIQVWQVDVTLSTPWPQGDGQSTFPSQVLVVRDDDGWKFERFLLKDELVKYTGGQP